MKKWYGILVFIVCLILLSGRNVYAKGMAAGCQIRVPKNTTLYVNAKGKSKLGEIKAGTVLTVLGQKNHRFCVKYKKKRGWISEKHVWINLVDYIPSIEYKQHLTRKRKLFNIKGNPIKGINKKPLYQSKGVRNGTQCWLNFKAAKKLKKAQKALLRDGYSLVVYDAYRPLSVSRKLYKAVSESPYVGQMGGPVGDYIALRSAHNKAVAVDVSLKNLETGQELVMPTPIMTLGRESSEQSWIGLNTEGSRNAKMLRKYMTEAGFCILKTEWWHFQDGDRFGGTFLQEDYYDISQ